MRAAILADVLAEGERGWRRRRDIRVFDASGSSDTDVVSNRSSDDGEGAGDAPCGSVAP